MDNYHQINTKGTESSPEYLELGPLRVSQINFSGNKKVRSPKRSLYQKSTHFSQKQNHYSIDKLPNQLKQISCHRIKTNPSSELTSKATNNIVNG